MKKRVSEILVVSLLLILGWGSLATSSWAIDTGWMQKGVRLWYFGGIDSGGLTSSNAEEAYLIDSIEGTNINLTHHSALEYWSSPRPVETGSYPLQEKGPCWIHPLVLQNLKAGDSWMGQEITLVTHLTSTYNSFPYHLLPAWALFRLKPQRELVKLSYKIPGFSDGNAYFDAETGILLYYHSLWEITNKMFFILSEINYDFGTGKAFAEDDGPHTGFKSIASEQSMGNMSSWPILGGGSINIQSLVETRYGNTVEMTVLTSLAGPSGAQPLTFENFCFFGDIPQVRYKDKAQASNIPPENWDPYGEYLWWWIPPNGLDRTPINVRNVPMSRNVSVASLIGAAPSTFSATTFPPLFYFSDLMFGGDGYLTQFSAKDPRLGLDVRPQDYLFTNSTTVSGLDYFRNSIKKAFPVNYDRLLYLPILLR